MRLAISLLCLALSPSTLCAADVHGPDLPSAAAATLPNAAPAAVGKDDRERGGRNVFENLGRRTDTFTLVSDTHGLSFHKPIYLMPLTWSEDFQGDQTELIFQISLKQRLFNRNFFFGYTQKSFWQVYNSDDSRPFRETNYNPEFFYRYKPHWRRAPGLGFDIGIDHESNGAELPDSRSWNRVIGAVFLETPRRLLHLRLWYRLPEDDDRALDDPKRDDNPDIHRYFGYGELRWQQRLFGESGHSAALMLRGNPSTGHGAVSANYSAPFSDWAFWNLSIWHGYGESLIDYNRSTTRIGLGLMLAR
ncbi:phospholipase A [Sinimarinibacterium thermocellulolyticum]|uniref:Phospholipase A1 n=1 Tax=Sinimarinibacterium thermocellulolyticum TaxID=3170016 RepID=A0ABV2ADU3_9GAMM